MAVRLASLKATAELDAQKYVAGARQVDEANKKMAGSQAGVKTSMQQTQARTSESARSFDRYRQSIDPAYRAQERLATGTARLNAALQRGQITADIHARQMTLLQQRYGAAASQTGTLGNSFGALRERISGVTTVVSGLVAAFVAYGAIRIARDVIDTALAFERIDKTLVAATGSATLAANEMKILRATAEELGLDLRSSALEFGKLAAAARGTALEGQGARDIFRAVSEASVALSLSAEQTGGALTAIQQIISKGTVSSEELRGQLGERLPGAFQIAARAVGVTTEKLGKMLQQGEVIASDFLPKFATELRRTFADSLPTAVSSAQAAFNRFENSLNDLKLELARGGFLDAVVDAMADLRAIMTDPAFHQGIRDFGAGIKSAFEFIVNNKDLLLTIAAAYFGAKIGRIGGPIGVGVGAIGGAVLASPGRDPKTSAGSGFLGATATDVLNNKVSKPKDYSLFDRGVSVRPDYSVAELKVQQDLTAEVNNTNTALGRGTKEREKATEQAAREAERREKSLNDYIKGLDDELKLSKLTGVARKQEEAVLRATALIQDDRVAGEERLSDVVEKQIRDKVALIDLEEQQLKAVDERAEEERRAQEDLARRQQEFNEDVLGETADTIANLWEGGKDGLDDTLQYWKRKLLRWLAEMAAQFILSPLIVPVVQGGGSGFLGANFGGDLFGGGSGGSSGNIGPQLSSLGKSIDSLGSNLGLQGFRPSSGTPSSIRLDGQGLFGSETFLSDVVGTAGLAYAVYEAGSSIAQTIVSLTGKQLSADSLERTGQVGGLFGGLAGGIFGSLFGSKPSNATARINFDENYNRTQVPFSKETAETRAAINAAADQISGFVDALESVGTTFTDQISAIAIGTRDQSYIVTGSGKTLRSAVGDPNALALTAIKELIRTASFESDSLSQVAKGDFGTLEELASALDFVRNTYDVIANAKPALTGTEQAMKSLTEGLKAARKEAEKYGLSVDKLNAGARQLFDFDIASQIQSITDPVGAALSEFERGAVARLNVAKELGADLIQVEKLNALERSRIIEQAAQTSVAGLKSLINDIEFGGLSLGVSSSDQYFSALKAYNEARAGALEASTPESLQAFESASRALLPIAQSFLGTSTRFAEVRSGVLDTARQLGTAGTDAATAAIIAATTQGSAATVEAVQQVVEENKKTNERLDRMNAFMQAFLQRFAA